MLAFLLKCLIGGCLGARFHCIWLFWYPVDFHEIIDRTYIYITKRSNWIDRKCRRSTFWETLIRNLSVLIERNSSHVGCFVLWAYLSGLERTWTCIRTRTCKFDKDSRSQKVFETEIYAARAPVVHLCRRPGWPLCRRLRWRGNKNLATVSSGCRNMWLSVGCNAGPMRPSKMFYLL